MYAEKLQCVKCQATYELIDYYSCSVCGGILDVRYDYERISKKHTVDQIIPSPGMNIWRYRLLLPVSQEEYMTSLQEGGTPLVRSESLAKTIGARDLFIKDETRNPSGAFKDRPMSVGISQALQLKKAAVATASSGNGAASIAMYAAKAKLACYIFIPEATPIGKVAQSVACGAKVIKVKGDYSNSFRLAKQAASECSWMNLTSTFLNPYTVEGDKTVAYELFHQLGRRVPDWVIIPTGAGPLVYGIYKGFAELRGLGITSDVPRMVAVQAEGCKPIVSAYESNRSTVTGWEKVRTIASAIADPLRGYEQDGERVLQVIGESKGAAVAVSDEEVVRAVLLLAQEEGIFVEPAAAVSIAGLDKLIRAGTIQGAAQVVCLVTGHGLKDPTSSVKNTEVPVIGPDIAELRQVL
jgi:threonine synthase